MLDSFDQGPSDLTNYTFYSTDNASITATAAHDGPYGLQLGDETEWMYRTDAATHVQQGNVISGLGGIDDQRRRPRLLRLRLDVHRNLDMALGENTGSCSSRRSML